ncbi:MAG: aldehyde dehydrogenase family protein, partial [Eubacteriales bacterium]|nr:aldehyde dehydrogenase family protein [Eubacteriales bacterium]
MEIKRYQNYIGSSWKDSSNSRVVQIKSPCDGTVVSEIADSNTDDVNEAVTEAKRAFYEEDWAFNPRLRATVLSKWAIKMRENFDMLVERLSLESGKPLNEARIEIN